MFLRHETTNLSVEETNQSAILCKRKKKDEANDYAPKIKFIAISLLKRFSFQRNL